MTFSHLLSVLWYPAALSLGTSVVEHVLNFNLITFVVSKLQAGASKL